MNEILSCTGLILLIATVKCSQAESADSLRDRTHISSTLKLGELEDDIRRLDKGLNDLTTIYTDSIHPLEEVYHFKDIGKAPITGAEINSKPMVLFVGPWSTGKSTMINYLTGVSHPAHNLRTGAEPTTSEFTVLMGGSRYKTVEGLVLAADKQRGFSALETFGQGFLERLSGIEMPYEILNKVVFVDTPGIIENRKQQERGYPFNEVMKWFIDRADLIFVVFDPTKLDVGSELESLFQQLKGHEAQIRIILNKADSIATQELMRVYGALFWSLAPLINVTEPPRVYMGSFWDKPYRHNTNHELFQNEEISLLQDMQIAIANRLENKVAFVRKYAIQVRIHAMVVDTYLRVFHRHKSILGGHETLITDIIDNPQRFKIFQMTLAKGIISKYDLPDASIYQKFFTINALNTFKAIEYHCYYFSECLIDRINTAIRSELPNLLTKHDRRDDGGVCTKDGCSEEPPVQPP